MREDEARAAAEEEQAEQKRLEGVSPSYCLSFRPPPLIVHGAVIRHLTDRKQKLV